MALYLEAIPSVAQCKRVLVFHNVASYQYDRMFRIGRMSPGKLRLWLFSRMMRWWEPRYAERFDRCITMSEDDRQLLTKANPRLKVDVIPNGVDTQTFQPLSPEETKPSVLFIGSMNYLPCADAAIYFCNYVLPHIRRSIGELQVWLVGRDPPPSYSSV
jgi:glycosyltransferase involved in cell wall biosynthesis